MNYDKFYSKGSSTDGEEKKENWLARNAGTITAVSQLANLASTGINTIGQLRALDNEGLVPYGVAYDQEGTRRHYDAKGTSAMDAISKAKIAAPKGTNFKAFRLPDQEDQYQDYCSSMTETKKMSKIYSWIPGVGGIGRYMKGRAYLSLANKGLNAVADFHDKWKYGTQRDQQARSYYLAREGLATEANLKQQAMNMQRGIINNNNMTAYKLAHDQNLMNYKMNHDNNQSLVHLGDQTAMMQAMNPNTTVIPQQQVMPNYDNINQNTGASVTYI